MACSHGAKQDEAQTSPGGTDSCLQLVKQVFQIECDHMKPAGKSDSRLSTYDFRAEAFQLILNNPDRKLLMDYEIIYQKIADLEFRMTETEKGRYLKEVDALYALGCP